MPSSLGLGSYVPRRRISPQADCYPESRSTSDSRASTEPQWQDDNSRLRSGTGFLRERDRVNLQTIIIIWLFCGAVAAAIGHTKNRNVGASFLLGALLGVLGVIIVIFLPRKASPGMAQPGWYPDPEGTDSERYWNGSEWSDLPPRPTKSQQKRPSRRP